MWEVWLNDNRCSIDCSQLPSYQNPIHRRIRVGFISVPTRWSECSLTVFGTFNKRFRAAYSGLILPHAALLSTMPRCYPLSCAAIPHVALGETVTRMWNILLRVCQVCLSLLLPKLKPRVHASQSPRLTLKPQVWNLSSKFIECHLHLWATDLCRAFHRLASSQLNWPSSRHPYLTHNILNTSIYSNYC